MNGPRGLAEGGASVTLTSARCKPRHDHCSAAVPVAALASGGAELRRGNREGRLGTIDCCQRGRYFAEMSDSVPLTHTRRDFLGAIGLILAAPSLGTLPGGDFGKSQGGNIFVGSLRGLATTMGLDSGWQREIDGLIESVGGPISDWIVGANSRLSMTMDWCSVTPQQLVASLNSRGVRAICEVGYHRRTDGRSNSEGFFVEIIVCNEPLQTAHLWMQIEGCSSEWQLEPSIVAGDAMFVSHGGNGIPGKIWFRRGNVLVSVLPAWVPPERAAQFAAKLDAWILQHFPLV